MKDVAEMIKEDKSLWKMKDLEDAGKVLLVEENYYDYVIQNVVKLQKENEAYTELIATILGIVNETQVNHIKECLSDSYKSIGDIERTIINFLRLEKNNE